MDGVSDIVVVKLGGSVITNKDTPCSLRADVVDSLSNVLGRSPLKKVVVHGGGSFGHYYAKKAGISTSCGPVEDIDDVFLTREAMFELNKHLLRSLHAHGLHPYVISPFVESRDEYLVDFFLNLLGSGFTPVLFGDVIPCKGGFKVISGDDISYLVCSILKPSRMIFCIDVDGVYPSSKMDGAIISEFDCKMLRNFVGSNKKFDVTGGIRRKLEIACKIASLGTDVLFVNGFKPDVVLKALNGLYDVGTCIRGKR
ncbi:MAG: isopentenyl phosphate kinase [Nitrososphaeria archaeon]